MSDLNFSIEIRAGVPVLLHEGIGCRPASDAETVMWDRIATLESKLGKAREALEEIVRGDPTEHHTRKWYSTAKQALAALGGQDGGEHG